MDGKLSQGMEEVDLGDFNRDFTDMKKKKKKKRVDSTPSSVPPPLPTTENKPQIAAVPEPQHGYPYDFLLSRVYDMVLEKDPHVLSVRKKFASRPPILQRVGTKKIRFVNFMEIVEVFKRPANHLMEFILVELGTIGSLDANDQLTVKGRYEVKQIEAILRKYIKEFVLCPNCKSSDTTLQKELRLAFLICENCGSKRSVSNIKTGLHTSAAKS